VFRSLDVNSDGHISPQELRDGFKTLGLRTEQEADLIFQQFDTDGVGYLNFTEFKAAANDWKTFSIADKLE